MIRYRNVRGGRRCHQATPQGSTIVTIAGTSAGAEARRFRGRADEHRRQAEEAEQQAGRYEIAERTGAGNARVLAPLAGIGYHLLADRRRPGSKHAQVDMNIVGSAGVFIVDTKAWREVAVHSDRIHRGQKDVTDDIARLADLVHGAGAALAEIGLPPGEVHAVVALAGQRRMHAHVASVDVVDRERRELERRELYVGMTRARDGLWVGTNAH